MEKHSLSWFKKRTAALNKQLGTHLSPTDLYKNQSRRRDTVSVLERYGDPRSASRAADRTVVARAYQNSRWENFIASNLTASTLAESLGVESRRLSTDGKTLYIFTPPNDKKPNEAWLAQNLTNGRFREVAKVPKSAQLVTERVLENALRKTAERARQFRARRNALANYRNGWI